jgi:hypothetical protein
MNSTLRRVVQQTYQRSVKAIANNESDGAELEIWWSRLSGMVKGGLTEPITWQHLNEITQQMASGGVEGAGEASEPDKP